MKVLARLIDHRVPSTICMGTSAIAELNMRRLLLLLASGSRSERICYLQNAYMIYQPDAAVPCIRPKPIGTLC